MSDKLKCIELWHDWIKIEPNCREVSSTKEKMKNYDKNDWKVMSEEAENIIKNLKFIKDNNINYASNESKKVFLDFVDHLKKWFFEPDNVTFNRTIISLTENEKYKTFYNQYGEGISECLKQLILFHKEKYLMSAADNE